MEVDPNGNNCWINNELNMKLCNDILLKEHMSKYEINLHNKT